MLAHDRRGSGPRLLLLHGTPGSRRLWDGVIAPLAAEREVIALDLPGFGDSAPIDGAALPHEWLEPIAQTIGRDPVAVVGSSMGGWVALEMAKAGRASAVLALAPAGLWRRRSPASTNAGLRAGRLMARLGRPLAPLVLRPRWYRRLAFRAQSHDAGRVPVDWTVAAVDAAARSPGWPAHFRAAKRERFRGGAAIDVPVRVVYGDDDRIAKPWRDERAELPAHATVETWPACGHLVMWDAPERLVEAALALPTGA